MPMSRIRSVSVAALLVSVLVAGASAQDAAPAAQMKALGHDLEKVNPVFRSWTFTSPGDSVEYTISGFGEADNERRTYLGEKDGKKVVRVERFAGTKALTNEIEGVVPENKPKDEQFLDFFRRAEYGDRLDARIADGETIPCIILENSLAGRFIYSEDVPLGGVVASDDYRAKQKKELVRFKRKATPAPSTRALEVAKVQDSGEGISVRKETDAKKGGRKAEETPEVRALESRMKEDADSTPLYFASQGEPTDQLDANLYLLHSGHLNQRLSATYGVQYKNVAEPTRDYSYSKTVEVVMLPKGQTPKSQDGDKWYKIETISSPSGTLPDGLVADKPMVTEMDLSRMPWDNARSFYVTLDSREVGGRSKRPYRKYLILAGPEVERTATEGGGEKQEILRRRIDLLTSTEDPMQMAQVLVYERFYYQEADASGKILDSSYEEATLATTLRNEKPIGTEEVKRNLLLALGDTK